MSHVIRLVSTIPSKAVFLALCLFVTIAVPTAAVTVGETETTDDVVLESTSPYAITSNDELELDFDALNDRAISTFDDVFTITVTDETVDRVWISSDIDAVNFYQGGDPAATVDESTPIEPTPNEPTSIGVEIDTRAETPSSETFTIHVEYENEADDDDTYADVELTNVDYSDTDFETGDTLTVNATYRNYGDDTGSTITSLIVDGVVVDRQVVHVGPGTTETVTFERPMDRSGAFEVGVDDQKPKAVTVRSPDEPAADFEVTAAELEADTITSGESAVVTAAIENTGNATGEMTAELAVGGVVVDDRPVALEPNESTTVTFAWRLEEPGEYAIAVSGVDAGTVTVTDGPQFAILNRELPSSTAAAVAPAAVVGLLFVVTGVRRREIL